MTRQYLSSMREHIELLKRRSIAEYENTELTEIGTQPVHETGTVFYLYRYKSHQDETDKPHKRKAVY